MEQHQLLELLYAQLDDVDAVNLVFQYVCQPENFAVTKTGFALHTWNGDVWSFTPPPLNPICVRNVVQVCSTDEAFAALLEDSSVVTWEAQDTKTISHVCSNVQSLHSTDNAFCGLTKQGEIFSWGDDEFGGWNAGKEINNVYQVYSTRNRFIAQTNAGRLVMWGGYSHSHNPRTLAIGVKRVGAVNEQGVVFCDQHTEAWWFVGWEQLGSHPLNDHFQGSVQEVYACEYLFAFYLTGQVVHIFGGHHWTHHDFKQVSQVHSCNTYLVLKFTNNQVCALTSFYQIPKNLLRYVPYVKEIHCAKSMFLVRQFNDNVIVLNERKYKAHPMKALHSVCGYEEWVVGVHQDNSLVTWSPKPSNYAQIKVKIVSINQQHSVALLEDGRVLIWENGTNPLRGQLSALCT